ncbi:MAG: hypothetical protein ACXVCF_02195 [Isosphaeraceae bacterium]
MIVLNSLAAELGCDTSHFRRYAKRHGVTPHKRRTAESGNQLALYITDVEADFLRERRKEDGFTASVISTSHASASIFTVACGPWGSLYFPLPMIS